jgi:lipopolysaccharide biosynthesis glycosyltransferase
MKSCLLSHLLTNHQKVIFLDCDLFFVNNYHFLFDYLSESNIILTPHWRNIVPDHPDEEEVSNFNHLFTRGIFNAGFVGCNKYANEFLDWWGLACLKNNEKNMERGFYFDQKYLDIVPVYFEKVKIIDHKGCNVSEWNQSLCKRKVNEKGKVHRNTDYWDFISA